MKGNDGGCCGAVIILAFCGMVVYLMCMCLITGV